MNLQKGFKKLIDIFVQEDIPYMIVGGFATSYYNRYRYTADIDCVLQIYPAHIKKIVQYFPEWLPSLDAFRENAQRNVVFNLIDFESGVKYDFMLYHDSDYNWEAFNRRQKIEFDEIECYIASPEDLFISKLIWYNISKSGKQWEDLEFLLTLDNLDKHYIQQWTAKLFIKHHGLL
jgi:hypothetical protein